ncbi:hypothetical protein ACLBR5_12790 [Escherichia coli]
MEKKLSSPSSTVCVPPVKWRSNWLTWNKLIGVDLTSGEDEVMLFSAEGRVVG